MKLTPNPYYTLDTSGGKTRQDIVDKVAASEAAGEPMPDASEENLGKSKLPPKSAYLKNFQPDTPPASYLQNFQPDPVDPAVISHAAADVAPNQAVKALDISNDAGVDPSYVAFDLDAAARERDKARFELNLRGRPVLAGWAAQSPQHAAAIKHDAAALGQQEGWFDGWGDALQMGFADIGHAEAMREYMGSGGPLAKYAVSGESALREYDSKAHGYAQQIARAIPQMVMYGAATTLTGGVGLAGLLYMQNKGILARQIQMAQPGPPSADTGLQMVRGKDGLMHLTRPEPEPEDVSLTPDEIDKYATAGSVASAVTLAGLLGPLVRSFPGVKQGLQAVSASVLARGAATTIGQAAIRSLSAWGAHSLMGALGMTLQKSINDATVQKSTYGDIDAEQLAREAGPTFLHVLPIAVTFGALGPARDFLADRGRINAAPAERARLDAQVELARQAALTNHSKRLASELFGLMGQGAMVYIDYRAAKKVPEIPPADVAAAEASMGDVAVPASEYLARMTDSHEAIKDDVKLTADGMTMRDARDTYNRVRKNLSPEQARALYGKMSPDELIGLEMPIAADLSEEQKTAFNAMGSETQKFKKPGDTVTTPPLHEVMANEYGGTPEQWAAKLTPELMAALNEEGSVGAISPEEHAARVIEATPIGEINPEPHERLAKKSEKYIQEAAEKARTGSVAGAKAASPADVAVLQTHEMARDVNRAKAAKAAEVKAEMDAALDKLTTQAGNQKLRALLNKAGGPLLNLFDALTEGTSASKTKQGWMAAHQEAVDSGAAPFSTDAAGYADSRMKSALRNTEQWFKDMAAPFTFDEPALQGFLDKPRPWSELTPPEARNILDAVKQLTTAAREQSILRDGDVEASLAEVKSEIIGELRQNPSKGLPPSTMNKDPGWWQKRMIDANAANAIMLRAKNNFREKSITLMKRAFDRINQAVYDRDALFRETGEMWETAFDAVPKEIADRRFETYDLSDKLPSPGTEPLTNVPRDRIWKLARHMMSKGNMERVVSTSGWDESTLRGILFDDPKTKLTIPEWDYLQSLADVNEKYVWPKLKAHFEKFYGQAPPKTAAVPFRVQMEDGTWKDYAGGYEPLKRDARPGVAPQAEPTKGIAQYWGRDMQIPWTPGSVKERVDNSHYLVNMDWGTSKSTMGQVLHWLAFDQPVRDVAKLLNDQELTATMNEFMGEGRTAMAQGWLTASATRQSQAIPEGMGIVTKAFGWQRRLQLMGIVGASGRLAVTQLWHPIGLMLGGQINPIYGIPALVHTLWPVSLANGEVRLLPNWNDAITYGQEVQHRADNAFNFMQSGWDKSSSSSKPGPIGALGELAQKTAGLYLHAVDRITTTWAWTAAHNEAVAKLKMEPFSEEAKYYANSKTQDVMPVHDIETAPALLSNRQVGMFLIMHGFKSTLYNMRQDALAKSTLELHQANGVWQTSNAVARAAGRVALQLAMFGGFAVAGKLTLGYGQQSDETKSQWLARDFLGGQTADLPFVGGLGEPAGKLLSSLPARMKDEPYSKLTRHDFTTFGNPGMAAMNKLYDTLGAVVNEGRAVDKKVFDMLEAALFFGGVPSRPPRVAAEHLYRMVTGEEYEDSSDVGGHFMYNEKQWNSIKRSLTPDED